MKWITDGSTPEMKNRIGSLEVSNPIVVSNINMHYLVAYCNDLDNNDPPFWFIPSTEEELDDDFVKMWYELPDLPEN